MNHDQKTIQSRFVSRAVAAIIASTAGFAATSAFAAGIEQATIPDFDALRVDPGSSLLRFAHAATAANITASLADRGIIDTSGGGCFVGDFAGANWESGLNLAMATVMLEELAIRTDTQGIMAYNSAEGLESFLDCVDDDKVAVSVKPFFSPDSGKIVSQIREAFVGGDAVNLTVYLPNYIDLGGEFGVVAWGGTHFDVTLKGVSAKAVFPPVFSIADPIYDDDNAHNLQSAFRFPTTRVGEEGLTWVSDPNNPYDSDEGVKTTPALRLYDAAVPAYIVSMTRARDLEVFTPSGTGSAIDITPGGGRDSRNKDSIPAPDGEFVKDLTVAPNGRDMYVITEDSTGQTTGWFVENNPEPAAGDPHYEWINLVVEAAATTIEWIEMVPAAQGAAALLEINGQPVLFRGGVNVAVGDVNSFAPIATLPTGFSMLASDVESGEIFAMEPFIGEVRVFDADTGTETAGLLLPAVQSARRTACSHGNVTLKRGIMSHIENTDGTATITYTGLEFAAGGAPEILGSATGTQFVGTDLAFLDEDTVCIANAGFLRCFDLVEVVDPATGLAEIDFVEVAGSGPIECGPSVGFTPNYKIGPSGSPLVPEAGALPELPGFIEACVADVTTTGATIEGQPGYAVPDGIVGLDDLGFFLNLWVTMDTRADMTTTGATIEGQPGFGIGDGAVDLDDLGFYLNAWMAGCS